MGEASGSSAVTGPAWEAVSTAAGGAGQVYLRALASLGQPLNSSTRRQLDRIEDLRSRLLESAETIETVDFGAGSPTAGLSARTMHAGVKRRTTIGDGVRRMSKSPEWCRLLFGIVAGLRVERALELGTGMGISAAYQATAIAVTTGGQLVTIEGSPTMAGLAETHLKALDLLPQFVTVEVGRFCDILGTVLDRVAPLDYVFVDGHHDEAATLSYFTQIKPYLSPSATVAFDDIDWSDGMRRAWAKVIDDPAVALSLDCGRLGLATVDSQPVAYRLAMTVCIGR